jgi:hypothetical protein
MSSHLIQTIDIEGTRYCVKHGASTPKWRTVSLFEPVAGNWELVGAEDDDEWRIGYLAAAESGYGYIRFATYCVWKITIRATSNNPDSEKFVYTTINGDVEAEWTVFYDESSVDIVIDLNALGLMNRPCGNEWLIYAGFVYSFDQPAEELHLEIIDVTFGPPV